MCWTGHLSAYLLCCVLLLGWQVNWSAAVVTRWTPATFPNPLIDVDKCGRRGVKSWICDPDGVISYSSANVIESILQKIALGTEPYMRANCGGDMQGFQVAVALMRAFDASSCRDLSHCAEAFAKELHTRWGVGDPRCNNGVLFLLSIRDRRLYINTGRGAQQHLADDQLDLIIEHAKPLLREKRYDGAVEDVVVNIGLGLAGHRMSDHSGEDVFMLSFFFLLVVGVCSCSFYSSWRKRRRYNECKAKLERIKKDQEAIRRNEYRTRTCPICLEDLATDRVGEGSKEGDDGVEAAGASPTKETTSWMRRMFVRSARDETPGVRTPLMAGQAPRQVPKRPLVLRCGHGFCEPCISEWLKTKNTCPVCRKDLDGQDPPADRDRPQGSNGTGDGSDTSRCSSGQRQPQNNLLMELRLMELAFRLQSLHRLYPDYVTTHTVQQWEQDIRDGRTLNADSWRQFELRDPRNRIEMESRGAGGTSFTFGGGSGYGGGGRGGSW